MKKVKDSVLIATKYWSEKDFVCDWNDWWNNIGIGMYIPDILLYGVDGLDDETKHKLLNNFKATLLYNEEFSKSVKERKVGSTGGNLTDQVISTLKVAVIENDGNTIMWLKSLVENELTVFPSYKFPMKRCDSEGIKEDMSFHQHDQCLYFGGYGEVFVNGVNKFINYTKNTQLIILKE